MFCLGVFCVAFWDLSSEVYAVFRISGLGDSLFANHGRGLLGIVIWSYVLAFGPGVRPVWHPFWNQRTWPVSGVCKACFPSEVVPLTRHLVYYCGTWFLDFLDYLVGFFGLFGFFFLDF